MRVGFVTRYGNISTGVLSALLRAARRLAVNKNPAHYDLALSVRRFYCQKFENLF